MDLEASTFQKRPCYRYIRESDHLPAVDEGWVNDPIAKVKLFNPTGAGTWYITAYDPINRRAYWRAEIQFNEYGYIDMAELVAYRGRFGLPIERDLHLEPRPLSACA